jgi:bifunctional non-homologous end joining protein LigD
MVRHAAFKGLREDKPAEEVETELPANPETTEAPATGLSRSRGGRADVMGVGISHLDKALWPDAEDGRPVSEQELAKFIPSRINAKASDAMGVLGET